MDTLVTACQCGTHNLLVVKGGWGAAWLTSRTRSRVKVGEERVQLVRTEQRFPSELGSCCKATDNVCCPLLARRKLYTSHSVPRGSHTHCEHQH